MQLGFSFAVIAPDAFVAQRFHQSDHVSIGSPNIVGRIWRIEFHKQHRLVLRNYLRGSLQDVVLRTLNIDLDDVGNERFLDAIGIQHGDTHLKRDEVTFSFGSVHSFQSRFQVFSDDLQPGNLLAALPSSVSRRVVLERHLGCCIDIGQQDVLNLKIAAQMLVQCNIFESARVVSGFISNR